MDDPGGHLGARFHNTERSVGSTCVHLCVCAVGVGTRCWLSGGSVRKKKTSKMTPRSLN